MMHLPPNGCWLPITSRRDLSTVSATSACTIEKAILTKDIEKLEEEKRIQEELERKRLEEEERQRKREEEKRRVEEEKRKAEELKRLQEEAVRDGLFIFLLA